jgi:hypothetical protein
MCERAIASARTGRPRTVRHGMSTVSRCQKDYERIERAGRVGVETIREARSHLWDGVLVEIEYLDATP